LSIKNSLPLQEQASVGVKRAERTAPKHRLEYGQETLKRAAKVMEDQVRALSGRTEDR
jgi:hypothetical protein